jgi:membrane protease YdiL (CAAX protease family)
MYPFFSEDKRLLSMCRQVLSVLLGLLILWALLTLLYGGLGIELDVSQRLPHPISGVTLLFILIAPLWEEALFRGWTLHTFRICWGWSAWVSLAVSATLFALLHSFDVLSWQFVWPLCSGVLLGLVTLRYQSWGIACGAHFSFNILSIFSLLFLPAP